MSRYVSETEISGSTDLADISVATPLYTTTDPNDPNHVIYGNEVADGAVLVNGTWQVKGAYFHVNLGPTLRYRFSERWAISGSLGVSMCFVGTVFKVDEQFYDSDNNYILSAKEENSTHKFVPGYYGSVNMEYWVSERTGFYVGADYQKLGNYSQIPLSGRTAKIDLGTASGWRVGIMTRF
jgi:hypothetical protein